MSYDKAVEEIRRIIENNSEEWHIILEERLDKDLSDFLKRFEENMIETNREEIEAQTIENYEPIRDESRD